SGSGPGARGEQQARARKNSQSDRPVAVAAESARPGERGREITSVRDAGWLGEVPCNRRRLGELRCARRCGGHVGTDARKVAHFSDLFAYTSSRLQQSLLARPNGSQAR